MTENCPNFIKSEAQSNSDVQPTEFEESPLVKNFKNAVAKSIEKYISYLKLSLFQRHFPGLDAPSLHSQLVSQLQPCFAQGVAELLEETRVERKVDVLHAMVAEAGQSAGGCRAAAWRPSGNPLEDLRDHLHPSKWSQKKSLEHMLKIMTAENKCLEEIMRKNHETILKKKAKIDSQIENSGILKENEDDETLANLEEKLTMELQKHT